MNDWKKIEDAVAGASELPIAEREKWLAEFCGADEDLKREASSMLNYESDAASFLERSVNSYAAIILSDEETELAGMQFGNYRIIREIGRGGMGAVFLAERSDGAFDQQVALKIVRQTLVDKDLEWRFLRERQILANLNHPNIAKLLDGGVSTAGEPFLAMEYIEGESLLDFAENHRSSLKERLSLFLKLCNAVSYAHRNLIIHRDIKPSNVIVNNDGEPKLLDFGLAKIVDVTTSNIDQTQTAFRALTPAYASPEQFRGESVTTASDIYSLGVVLYELLTNERPFHFEGKSLDEIIKTVTTFEPPPPSSNARTTIRNTQLKGDLDNIALLALRKEPERRYRTVEAFANDIERHLNGLPVSARPNTYKYRAVKYFKRHRIGVAAAFLVLASLVGGIAISLWQTRQATLEKAKAEAVNAFLQTMLDSSSPDNSLRKSDHELTVKEVLDYASSRLAAADLSGQLEVKAELQRIMGTSYLSLGQYDLAEQNLSAALESQTKLYGAGDPQTLRTLVIMARLWMYKGDYAQADKFYRQHLLILRNGQAKGTIESGYLFSALCDFALVRRGQGDSKEAELLLSEALALGPKLPSSAKSSIGIEEAVLALVLSDQGKFEQAENIIRDKIAVIRNQEQRETIELSANLTGLGSFQMERGSLSEAEQSLNESEQIYRNLLNKSNVQLGDNLRIQAQNYLLQGKYPEAENKINETLSIYRAATSSQYINYPLALTIQGLIFGRTGRISEGEKLLREAVRIRTENVPPPHFLLATANGALGEFLVQENRFSEAEPVLRSSYESLMASQADGSPRIDAAKHHLVELYENWGKPALAKDYR